MVPRKKFVSSAEWIGIPVSDWAGTNLEHENRSGMYSATSQSDQSDDQNEHHNWALLESVADGVVVVDRAGAMLFVSERLAALLGYESIELVGKDVEVLVAPKSRRGHRALRADFSRSSRVRPMGLGLDTRARQKDGTLLPVDIQLHPVGLDGLVVASVRDMRVAAETERQFQELTDRERDARAILDLVVQRLFGISATIAALSADSTPAAGERLMSSAMLIDETIELIRTLSGEAHGGRQNLASRQSELLRTSGPSR